MARMRVGHRLMKSFGMIARRGAAALAAICMCGGAYADTPAAGPAAERAKAHSLLGGYLAGRSARAHQDIGTAAGFYRRALERDPGNAALLDQSFQLEAGNGNWERALELARQLVEVDETHRIARYLLAVTAFQNGDHEAAERHLSGVKEGPIADLTAQLGRAWVLIGSDRPDEALAALDDIRDAEWSRFYQLYHKGLLAGLAGRTELADEAFSVAFERNPRTLRIAEAYARHVLQQGDTERAREILRRQIAETAGHPLTRSLLDDVKAGRTAERLVRDAAEGFAEVFYGIGDALSGEGGTEMGGIYLQLAILLRPGFDLAHMALGEVRDASKQPRSAIESYDRVSDSSPLTINTQIRKAFSLNALERVDEAIALLSELADKHPKEIRPLDALGNVLRSHERYEEASEAYARAIALVDTPEPEHWALYYSRGVCFERMKEWPKAEVDLQMALKLNPDQPLVLNYLGYSWVDQGVNLKEGMALIRKAVKLKPDDGYFVDSLGWAYYRMGDYKAATEHLERAVELRPEDPVINDHLGDAYWHVGRENEARFQWQQALTLDPEPEEAEKIKKKLEEGLDPHKRRAEAKPGASSGN